MSTMTTPAPYVRLCTRMWLRSPKSEAQRRLQTGQVTPVPGGGWTPAWRRWRFCRWSWRASVRRASNFEGHDSCRDFSQLSVKITSHRSSSHYISTHLKLDCLACGERGAWVKTCPELLHDSACKQSAVRRYSHFTPTPCKQTMKYSDTACTGSGRPVGLLMTLICCILSVTYRVDGSDVARFRLAARDSQPTSVDAHSPTHVASCSWFQGFKW